MAPRRRSSSSAARPSPSSPTCLPSRQPGRPARPRPAAEASCSLTAGYHTPVWLTGSRRSGAGSVASMRIRGAAATLAALTLLAGVLAATPAQAATSTTVTAGVVHGTGLGFDAASAPSTAQVRAWTASPYRAVNVYFSGIGRFDKTQAGLNHDWVSTVLSNGWALIPTVVDRQAPCYGGSKPKMSS